jgi:hydroxypyruvate isomerase
MQGTLMNRREAGKLMAAALLAPQSALAAPATKGVRFSFMLWALAKQASFDRCLEMVAAAGYQGVELTGEFRSWSSAERGRVMEKMRSLGLVVDAMSGVRAGFAVPEETSAFAQQFAEHIQMASDLHCPQVILLSGRRVPTLPLEAQRDLAIQNLQRAAEIAAKENIEIVIEPIDLLENPNIFLASVSAGFEIAQAVNQPNVKVLYDLYHEQRSFGNLTEKLEKNIAQVGLIHVADVPGRHEPGTGEIDYPVIYRKLAELHYDRWIAMEYYPTSDPVASLRKARIEVQQAMHAGT